ncbi:hypothetical protein CQA44_12145 [Helicobacter sp. MIT 14-3879]|nr:hypothetical protein CQA44_12145 [Helicobacter sp. MIT 14-3879]
MEFLTQANVPMDILYTQAVGNSKLQHTQRVMSVFALKALPCLESADIREYDARQYAREELCDYQQDRGHDKEKE